MPSEPDSGPIMICTLSCSTSLRVALTATSGWAFDEPLTNSIFLPPAMPFFWISASSAPRMPSWPPAAKGPSSVASRPTFSVSCAIADPANAANTAAAAIDLANILLPCFTSSSGWNARLDPPRGFFSGSSHGAAAAAAFRGRRVGRCAAPQRSPAPPRATRARSRFQMPTRPSGENSTTARNTPPITRLKRSRSTRSIAKFCSSTNTSAPTKAPIGWVMPPSTATISTLISAVVPTEPGEIRLLYQTISTPPTAAISPATACAATRWAVTW